MTQHSLPYITGMGYRSLCDFYYDEFTKTPVDKYVDNCKIFVKTDLIPQFFHYIRNYEGKFTIYTHNSDIIVNKEYIKYLEDKRVIKWYGQNVNFYHEKIDIIPIGLANKRWEHGNVEVIKEQQKKVVKNKLVYSNFDIKTNPKERVKCSFFTCNYKKHPKSNFENYIKELSEHYFCLSPNGNGIDCHKTWEALYLNTIPIVTESVVTTKLSKKYPLFIIDKWENFNKYTNLLTIDTYKSMISKYDFKDLYI